MKGIATTEVEGWSWCRPRAWIRLATKKPNAFNPSLYNGKTYATVFDATIIANPSGAVLCASPRPTASR